MNRRELLEGFGIASASTLLWALGCGGPQKATNVAADAEVGRDDVRSWLHDAVSRLAAVYPIVNALAVERRRSVAASDQLGAGIARVRRDGVVLTVRDRDGWHEQVTSDLTRAGVAAAVRALVPGSTKPSSIDFGPVPPMPVPPKPYGEQELRNRVEAITRHRLDSRIVYGVSLFDVEDTTVWFVAPGHDREQRALRVRQRVTRAAWNGARPAVGEVERGWIGEIVDRQQLGEVDAALATSSALALMTPAAFPDGKYSVLLDPSVVASLIDAGTRSLLTTAAARRPEVRKALAPGAMVASPAVTLIDDPTTRGAYGGFQFDDEGEAAAAVTLIDHGRLTATLADRQGRKDLTERGGAILASGARARRAGHIGTVEPSPSHLRLVPGTTKHDAIPFDGFWIEGGQGAIVDPGTTRVVLAAARAREIKNGQWTGRIYADVELVGDLGRLFGTVIAASSNTASFVYRDERDGEPRWRSVETPWVQIGADSGLIVRARRRWT